MKRTGQKNKHSGAKPTGIVTGKASGTLQLIVKGYTAGVPGVLEARVGDQSDGDLGASIDTSGSDGFRKVDMFTAFQAIQNAESGGLRLGAPSKGIRSLSGISEVVVCAGPIKLAVWREGYCPLAGFRVSEEDGETVSPNAVAVLAKHGDELARLRELLK